MRIYICILILFFSSFAYSNELDDFEHLLSLAQENYKAALKTTSSEQKRDYVRTLSQLSKSTSIISKAINKYKKYEEFREIRLTQRSLQLMTLYNLAKSRPEAALSFASNEIVSGRSGIASVSLQSVSQMEADRRGCYFMLNMWLSELKKFGYPDLAIPETLLAVKYTMLLHNFKLNSIALVGKKRRNNKISKISYLVRDHIKSQFRHFSSVASQLQKEGMRHGFSLTKYVTKVNSYINATQKINKFVDKIGVSQEIYDEFNYAIAKLEKFGQILAENPSYNSQKKISSKVKIDRNDLSSVKSMFDILKEYRKDILANDMSSVGLSYDPTTIKAYIKTLSKKEISNYKSTSRLYFAKGYDLERSKSTAIKKIHSYLLAGKTSISKSELNSIINKLGLASNESCGDVFEKGTNAIEVADSTDYDKKLEKLKKLRLAILSMNTHISGRSIDDKTIRKYEMTLSKKEKAKFYKLIKQYTKQGYISYKAKSSVVSHIHTLFMSGMAKIEPEELDAILAECERSAKY